MMRFFQDLGKFSYYKLGRSKILHSDRGTALFLRFLGTPSYTVLTLESEGQILEIEIVLKF